MFQATKAAHLDCAITCHYRGQGAGMTVYILGVRRGAVFEERFAVDDMSAGPDYADTIAKRLADIFRRHRMFEATEAGARAQGALRPLTRVSTPGTNGVAATSRKPAVRK
jgi:hypothetical protein